MGNNFNPSRRSPKKKNGKDFYHQGKYSPKNPQKYLGDLLNVVFRSKWEWCFMCYCDQNPLISKWSCEHIIIPYQDSKGRYHRYYPDFYIERIDPNDPNKFVRAIIEIKPSTEISPAFLNPDGSIKPPEIYLKKVTAKSMESYEYQLKTYQKNLQKWTRAKDWCKKHSMEFVLMSEKYLMEKKIM